MKRIAIFDFSSAYGQLVLLVFLPITVLAAVGAYLVEKEATKAIESEQRTLATAALFRYEPIVKQLLPSIVAHARLEGLSDKDLDAKGLNTKGLNTKGLDAKGLNAGQMVKEDSLPAPVPITNLEDVQQRIHLILTSMGNEQHIQRIVIVNEQGKVVASSLTQLKPSNGWINSLALTNGLPLQSQFIAGIPTEDGTAYGHLLGGYQQQQYWLFVDMDNEPLTIARMRMWLGLGSTGLFTLLMLLLSLNIYAKRWIAPVYELRLHLQGIRPDNMYQAVNTSASGELNQLQQDLIKTLRRLYADFQELKDHAEQTEADLRDAFDAMEMQNIRIREARDQAVSSSQAKSAFLANISHELRTPLNSIDGFINLLARHGNLTAEQDLYVQTIRKSSAHLLALVNDVLDFSKIEAGKLVLDKHEFSLYAAIYDVMDMLSPLAAQKGLRMTVMYYNDVPNTLIGDALRVKQVLTNLVGNAIKFTDVGEVVVRVSIDEEAGVEGDETAALIGDERAAQQSGAGNEMIHIAVQDTGRGISEAAHARLFKSFSQADPSITRQYGGTGLGLIISKQLTRLMGGNIGFYANSANHSTHYASTGNPQPNDAEPNRVGDITQSPALISNNMAKTGTTFWFNIPAHTKLDTPDTEASSTFSASTQEAMIFGQIPLPVLHPYATSSSALHQSGSRSSQNSGNTNPSPGNHKKSGASANSLNHAPLNMLVWIDHGASLQVFMAAIRPLNITLIMATSLAGALEHLKEAGGHWDWVIIDGDGSSGFEDSAALLKQIRLHYQGKLAIYGYQVVLDATLLERYQAAGLYQPLDKRQLYNLLDTRVNLKKTSTATPMWQGVTVLAVDDHLPNLLVLDALLSELGIQVVTANSGHDAIAKMSQHLQTADSIDLVFMDIQMPRMSGEEATQQIRELETNANLIAQSSPLNPSAKKQTNPQSAQPAKRRVPIIALTAHSLSDEKEKLIAAGFDDYVGKPISRPQLLQILQHWLGRGSEAAATTALELHADTEVSNRHNAPLGQQAAPTGEATDADGQTLIVDWQDALTRSANKPDLAMQLLTMMQNAVDDDIQDLQQAWQQRDREHLAQLAHRILGASRYTGVPQIRLASQHLEDKSLLNVQHTIPTQFSMLAPYYDQLIDSLKALKAIDLAVYIKEQLAKQPKNDKTLSENDMNWKMI